MQMLLQVDGFVFFSPWVCKHVNCSFTVKGSILKNRRSFHSECRMSTKSGKDWINASWHTARVPLPVSESVLIFARLCFKLVIQFLFAGGLVFILDHPNKSSKIQFSPPLTDCFLVTNQIIYTHGEQGTLTSKGFNSRQLLEDVKETQNLKLLRSEHNKEVRGRMQFILERVLPMVVKFFYNVSSGYT